MKILVADDDLIIRKMLVNFLTKADHDVQVHADGASALEGLMAEDSPRVAILDWMMPGLSGPEVCAKIRAVRSKIRPYVIILSAKSEKAAVADGLDAGADDFLTKPFNPLEMLARLRVAERTINYQIEVQQHVADLEALVRRYNLLGEIIGRHGGATGASSDAEAASPAANARPAASAATPHIGAAEIDAILQRALADIGLPGAQPITNEPGERKPGFTAWAGMILSGENVWADLIIELDAGAAALVFEKALNRRASSDQETCGLLAETHTIISSAFKAELQGRGADVLGFGLSRAVRTERLRTRVPLPEACTSRTYRINDSSVTFTVAYHDCPVVMKEPEFLKAFEVLAEGYPPPEVEAVPLLHRGAVLNERFIGKLVAFQQAEAQRHPVPVFVPSPIAALF